MQLWAVGTDVATRCHFLPNVGVAEADLERASARRNSPPKSTEQILTERGHDFLKSLSCCLSLFPHPPLSSLSTFGFHSHRTSKEESCIRHTLQLPKLPRDRFHRHGFHSRRPVPTLTATNSAHLAAVARAFRSRRLNQPSARKQCHQDHSLWLAGGSYRRPT